MELNVLPKGKEELIDVALVFDDEGEPEAGFKVVGANSEEYQAAERQWNLVNLKKSARRGRGIDASTNTGAEELADLLIKQERTLVYACVKEVYGFTNDGVEAPLNETTLDAIFAAKPVWRTKVLTEIRAERGFTKP